MRTWNRDSLCTRRKKSTFSSSYSLQSTQTSTLHNSKHPFCEWKWKAEANSRRALPSGDFVGGNNIENPILMIYARLGVNRNVFDSKFQLNRPNSHEQQCFTLSSPYLSFKLFCARTENCFIHEMSFSLHGSGVNHMKTLLTNMDSLMRFN